MRRTMMVSSSSCRRFYPYHYHRLCHGIPLVLNNNNNNNNNNKKKTYHRYPKYNVDPWLSYYYHDDDDDWKQKWMIQIRPFTSNRTNDDSNSMRNTTDVSSSKGKNILQKTDPEFAQYLTGNDNNDNDNSLMEDTNFHTNDTMSGMTTSQPSTPTTTTNHTMKEPKQQTEERFEWISSSSVEEKIKQTPNTSEDGNNSVEGEWGQVEDNDNNSSSSSVDGEEGLVRRHFQRNHIMVERERMRVRRVDIVQRALMGNLIITVCKFGAYGLSGSSAMLSESIHSVVDSGNQALLLIGLRETAMQADGHHPYGYGKSIYFWALVSALGTFFLGAGVSMTQAIPSLLDCLSTTTTTTSPIPFDLTTTTTDTTSTSHGNLTTWHVWAVLGVSFVVDGYVLKETLMDIHKTSVGSTNAAAGQPPPPLTTLWEKIWKLRDPATLAIVLEDGAACLGVLLAISGIGLTQYTDNVIYDAMAGVGISALLASMGIILVRVNHRFLLGQGVDPTTVSKIQQILERRRSIDNVQSIQTQYTGPETFSFKAEVDFDGTFLAAKLMPRYQQEFREANLPHDLNVLLSWYAEDVMRTVEREVKHIEFEIRNEFPGAEFIELEPMSKDANRFAIDDGMEAQIKRIEIEALNRYLKSLYQTNQSSTTTTTTTTVDLTTTTPHDDPTQTNNPSNNNSTNDTTTTTTTTIIPTTNDNHDKKPN